MRIILPKTFSSIKHNSRGFVTLLRLNENRIKVRTDIRNSELGAKIVAQ